ncbi:MAG: hypothetical protein AAB654_02400 [Acidobacteriota bacterium]
MDAAEDLGLSEMPLASEPGHQRAIAARRLHSRTGRDRACRAGAESSRVGFDVVGVIDEKPPAVASPKKLSSSGPVSEPRPIAVEYLFVSRQGGSCYCLSFEKTRSPAAG